MFILHHAQRCYIGNVLQHQNIFSCSSSSPQFLPRSHPSLPPSHSPFLVFPSFSDPFFMHYSITLSPHLHCITSSHLSQTHFILLSPSFSHFASLLPSLPLSPLVHTFLYFPPSPSLLSLCLFSGHVEAILSPCIFVSHLVCHSVNITLSVCSAVILPFNWLFKACHVIWYSLLPIVFALSTIQIYKCQRM